MAPLLAVRSHLGWLRRQHQLLLWLVLLTGLITLLVFRRADPGLLATLSGRNLTTMLQTLLVLVLLLIPISGVYSVISQFAFWNGWLGAHPTGRAVWRRGGWLRLPQLSDLSRRHSSE